MHFRAFSIFSRSASKRAKIRNERSSSTTWQTQYFFNLLEPFHTRHFSGWKLFFYMFTHFLYLSILLPSKCTNWKRGVSYEKDLIQNTAIQALENHECRIIILLCINFERMCCFEISEQWLVKIVARRTHGCFLADVVHCCQRILLWSRTIK